MTIDQSRKKSSPTDPTMNFVNALLQRARSGIIRHDAKAIAGRLRALRALRFPIARKPKTLRAPRAPRSHSCVRRATADSGSSGSDPDPEPPHRAHHIYSLPTLGGAL